MASIPPSTWAFPPNRTSSSSTKPLLFPPKRLRSLRLLPSSSGGGAPEGGEKPEAPDLVKLAFAKTADYRKSKSSNQDPRQELAPDPAGESDGSGDSGLEVRGASVKLAMEKAREYKQNKGGIAAGVSMKQPSNSGQGKMDASNSREGFVQNKVIKKEELKISGSDFVGLNFSDKKRYRGTPPGLVPVVGPLLEGALPEVEFIVGDASKFEVTTPSKASPNNDTDNIDLYKPKVSTWGVFPRPNNISKTFGGGRVIRPGEVLEKSEDKAAKEKCSRELIAAYKTKMGMSIDAKTKAECEKAINEGDKLMDLGKLREALPFYEKVMKDLVFQSELHGLAALQWSICQDSICRPNEARIMYEKLQSHPNVQVSKKARQFVYSFQAMEMMKIRSSSDSRRTGYENYFEAFVESKAMYTPEEEEQGEGPLRQALPYILVLLSPILAVFFIAVRKSFQF